MKKVINPYIDKILRAKAHLGHDVPQTEIDYVLHLYVTAPAFAWIATLLYGGLVIKIKNVKAFLICNIISSIGYLSLYIMPWSLPCLYLSVLTYALNAGCCFGAAVSYCQELTGPHNLPYASATLFVLTGIAGLTWDLTYPTIVIDFFDSNYFTSLILVNGMSLISVIINILLLYSPPPGPLHPFSPEWKQSRHPSPYATTS